MQAVAAQATLPLDPAGYPLEPPIVLSDDQQAAYDAFAKFILDPDEQVFVLEGFAGTGKSTLVRRLLEDLPKILRTSQLIDPDAEPMPVQLTATTNKAAEALAAISGRDVCTIHSYLGLFVHKDYATGATELRVKRDAPEPARTIVFIDEASYIDHEMLPTIFRRTHQCKLIFIGDPAQLLNVGSVRSPVFGAGFTTAKLTQVVRQAEGNPIIELASAFRNTVNLGEFFSFRPDGKAIQHLPREQFERAILAEFSRPDWHHNDSKVLAWTNKVVVDYNRGIREHVEGSPELQVGDYAICNSALTNKDCKLKTDQTVQVTAIEPDSSYDVAGWHVTLDGRYRAFLPCSLSAWDARLKLARKNEEWTCLRYIEEHWIDLRAAYACTLNKSQGSTYDRVFIDLDDVKNCRNLNTLARLLYVGVSRARHQVIFTGDLV